MGDREDKLRSLEAKKAGKNMVIISDGEPFIEAIGQKTDELRKTLGEGIELNNLDDLLTELEQIKSFKDEVEALKESIKGIDLPNSVSINGLGDLVKAVKTPPV